jgi:hypothetical protein
MAIYKAVTDSVGVALTYHRISKIETLFKGTVAQIFVKLQQYTSEEYRNLEKTYNQDSLYVAKELPLRLDMTAEDADGATRATIYTAIMALPEWEGSTAT